MFNNKIRTAIQTARDFGWPWTLRRVYYEFQLRTGHHKRRMPQRQWKVRELDHWLAGDQSGDSIFSSWQSNHANFFFSSTSREAIAQAIRKVNERDPSSLSRLKHIDIHRLYYFTKLKYTVHYPDIWFTNPFTVPASQCAPDLHWSDYPMYSEVYEDLKFIWEPGRFSIVFDLVRSYILNGAETAAENYWQLIESWIDHNPPNTGPHWKCGQETSLRLMAWYFGLFAFLDNAATTPERFEKFLGAVAAQADRISRDLQYSYLQHSNHAISEGLGLYASGLLFPQLRNAQKWKERGREILEERALFLIRPDGSYIQKSHNYLRFILQAYLYVFALADANGEQFSEVLEKRLKAAMHYLMAVIDPKSGKVPNFGSNDGALIFPVNACDFTDYRPVLSALYYYFHRERLFEPGPWEEDLIWLFGAESISKSQQATKEAINKPGLQRFDTGGVYIIRERESWAFIHAESYKDRPAHADALHVDLWWKGLNICLDPGTYLYYGHLPWRDLYKHTNVHNTITVDGMDQMERAYRFTWGYWHNCRISFFYQDGNTKVLEAEHDGYCRLENPVLHRRAVACFDGVYWIVVDDLTGTGRHTGYLHWLINDYPYFIDQNERLCLHTPEGPYAVKICTPGSKSVLPEVSRGDPEKSPYGLQSSYYAAIEPAIQLKIAQQGSLPQRFISCFGPGNWELTYNERAETIRLSGTNTNTRILLHPKGEQQLIKSISSLSNHDED